MGSLGPGGHKVCLSPLCVSLESMGFDSKCDFVHFIILLGFLLCPWIWDIFFWWDPAFDDCSVTSCNFGILAGEAEHTSSTSPSWSLKNLVDTMNTAAVNTHVQFCVCIYVYIS